jgi:hypothetical protein
MISCLDAKALSGRVTFITGPEKRCGKTSLLNAALASLRASGEKPAFFSIGFDGEAPFQAASTGGTRITCEEGEVIVSSERYLEGMSPSPELLEAVPGSTALGRLAIARARRAGQVTLVGPERNEYAAWIVERIRAENWARSILVDGSMNRITQVASFAGARFLFSLRVSESNMEAEAERMCRLYRLLSLRAASGLPDEEARGLYPVSGALTAEAAGRLPEGLRAAVVEDFTKVFLRASELRAFLRGRELYVRHQIEFGGFVVILREVSEARFLEVLARAASIDRANPAALLSLVFFNPYLVPAPGEAVR